MNRYYVKIDGQEAPESYTYEELRSMGVLDFDDIQVREMLDNNWHSAKFYNFPESSSTSQVEVDEYGQIRNTHMSQNNIQIDEFGQIQGVTTSSTSGSPSSNSSSPDDGVATFFKILFTIVIIGGAIAIAVATTGWGLPLAYGAWKLTEAIWKDD